MNASTCMLGASLICVATWAAAAGGDDPPSANPRSGWSPGSKAEDPALKSAKAAFAAGDYAAAQGTLKAALASDPGNADLHNLYAYSIRKGANPDMSLVFKHYTEALRIDPKHRGAQEYIGEAYLMVNDPAKAKEHLAALDKLCFFGCEEYEMLKKAIAAYEAKPKQ
jgi:tetratricopeptide (TPR) repeat protein